MEIAEPEKLRIYEISHHYLAFTITLLSSPVLNNRQLSKPSLSTFNISLDRQ